MQQAIVSAMLVEKRHATRRSDAQRLSSRQVEDGFAPNDIIRKIHQ